MAIDKQIAKLLAEAKEGLKARVIATELGVTPKEINSLLHSDSRFEQNKDDYSWFLTGQPKRIDTSKSTDFVPPIPTTQTTTEKSSTIDGDQPSTDNPTCPICDNPMVLRTARRGRNSGGLFWGCSQYPRCKGTRDSQDSPSVSAVPNGQSVAISAKSIKRRIVDTAPCSENHEVEFVCGTMLPRCAISAVNNIRMGDAWHALTQTRFDLAKKHRGDRIVDSSIFAIAEKLIRRGSTIPLSESIVEMLKPEYGDPLELPSNEWVDGVEELSCNPLLPRAFAPEVFDSDEEARFLLELVPEHAPHSRGWIVPQMSLGTLTGDEASILTRARVDFAVLAPGITPFVIEIDGVQHHDASQKENDKLRDGKLGNVGFEVHRVPAQEVRDGNGPCLDRVWEKLSKANQNQHSDLSPAAKWLLVGKRVWQLQNILLNSMRRGLADSGSVRLKIPVGLDDLENGQILLDSVSADLQDLLNEISACYGVEAPFVPSLVLANSSRAPLIDFDSTDSPSPSVSYIRDAYVPLQIEDRLTSSRPISCHLPDREACESLLYRVFGWAEFREGQFEAISRAIQGFDSVVLLPTGAGKSVAFQLASLLRPGLCIVVDPIISLIEDQVENLLSHGIDRVAQITGSQHYSAKEETLSLLGKGAYLFCYISPERFQNSAFRNTLREASGHTPIALAAIDEAHCVSEWGHDFRPSYLNLSETVREYCTSHGVRPPIMALTGTASTSVLKDVQRELGILDLESIITPKTFNRPELNFTVVSCRSAEKMKMLFGVFSQLEREFSNSLQNFVLPCGSQTKSGLVFCPWVNGDFGIAEVSRALGQHLNSEVLMYSGSAPRGFDRANWPSDKTTIAKRFKRNEVSVMACTKAFGMGIDKPNIRYTVHYALPQSIESFYQEAGRAGRDGSRAKCSIIYSIDFPERAAKLLDPGTSLDELQEVINRKRERGGDDDVTRALFFHCNSFAGKEVEIQDAEEIIGQLEPLGEAHNATVRFKPENRTSLERAIHRLVVLGVIADYTVDYSSGCFEIVVSGFDQDQVEERLLRYIAGYQRRRAIAVLKRLRSYQFESHNKFVIATIIELIGFVYDVVERGRRRALAEMLRLCNEGHDDDSIRSAIVSYLSRSPYSEFLGKMLDDDDAGLVRVSEIFESVSSSIDAAELRGECSRMLESYPDHPGLLLARAVSEALVPQGDTETVVQNTDAAYKSGVEKYDLKKDEITESVMMTADILYDSYPSRARMLVALVIDHAEDRRDAARGLISNRAVKFGDIAISVLANTYQDSISSLKGESK